MSSDFQCGTGRSAMSVEELNAQLPKGYRAEIMRGRGFWRCTIMNDLGQPWGIGEAQTPNEAMSRALESFKQKGR
jgi:hypothetical protein